MRRILLLGSVCAASLAGAAHAQSCAEGTADFSREAATRASIDSADPAARRTLREIANVANTLAVAGYEEACEAVVSAVNDMAKNRSVVTPAMRDGADRAFGQGYGGAYGVEGDWTGYDYTASAAEAKPFSEVAEWVASEAFIGADAWLMNGEDIGAVDGMMMDAGKGVTHLIVGYGGFLNIGDREVAVPTEMIRVDRDAGVIFIDATEEWFEDQPDYDREEWLRPGSGWTKDG
jgi:hypothetical protein